VRIVLTEFMSLDGVVQSPGGPDEDTDGGFAHGGWSGRYFDPDIMGAEISEGMDGADALLFGRRTYQTMAAAWPTRAGDPYADRMNAIRKYVASRSLSDADVQWNNSVLLPAGGALDAVRSLRAGPGRDVVVWGSSVLATQLVEAGLVDEYRLMISPVLLGGGKRIFPSDGEQRPLELVAAKTASTGTMVCTFRPA
jgi:dihydrofolate reductase